MAPRAANAVNTVKKVWHLLIGVNGKPQGSDLASAQYCVNDCKELALVLQKVTLKPGEYEPVMLHNGVNRTENKAISPTVEEVKTEIKRITQAAHTKDTILVYITCHGVVLDNDNQEVSKGGKTHLCLADTFATQDASGYKYHNALKLDDVVTTLVESQAEEIVLLIDACHSGGMPFPGEKLRDTQRFYAILSCHAHQLSYEEEPLGRALFTHYLIQGLLGEAAPNDRGEITATSIYEYVCRQMDWHLQKLEEESILINQCLSIAPNPTSVKVSSQTPILKASGTGTPVLAKVSNQANYPPRQALVVGEGLEELVTELEKSCLFEVKVGARGQDLLAEIKAKLQGNPFKPRKTVMLYLQGKIESAKMTLASGPPSTIIDLSQLKKILDQANLVQQVVILDTVATNSEIFLENWVKELGNPQRKTGQAIIGIRAPQSSDFLAILRKIFSNSNLSEGITAANLMRELQEKLNPNPQLWLSGSRGIIEIIPDPRKQKPYLTNTFWRGVARANFPTFLSTNLLTTKQGLRFNYQEVYVSLGLEERKKPKKVKPITESALGSQMLGLKGDKEVEEYETTKQFSGEEFLEEIILAGNNQKIAIIGQPGSGKTTYLQKINDYLNEQTEAIALWVSLADFATYHTSLEQYLQQKWLKDALKVGKVTDEQQEALEAQFDKDIWLLLDGIDEIVNITNPLKLIADNLKGWVGKANVVVTARVNIWETERNILEGNLNFKTYRTLPFEDKQIKDFLGKYMRGNQELAENLWKQLSEPNNRQIKDSVRNPLRLMLLCNAWHQDEKLPETRAALYSMFVERFYDYKDFQPTLRARHQLHQALAAIAIWGIDNPRIGFRLLLDKLPQNIREKLGYKDEENSPIWWALKIGWLNTMGVAAENSLQEVYCFFHPTFQEYFAAIGVDDWDFFLPRKHKKIPVPGRKYRIFESEWKEVYLFWMGREDSDLTQQKEELIEKLMTFEDGLD